MKIFLFSYTHLGTAENQRQFEEAMKNGHVKAWLCKLLMYGHAGSGKTTSMEIIVGNKPPKHRESTPLATRPTTIYRVNLESEEWAKLTTLNDRKSLLARALIRDAPELVDRLLATRSGDELSTNINPAPSKAETQVKVKNPANSGSNEPPVHDKPLLVSAEGGALDSLELDSSDEDIEAEADAILESISTDEELVKLMDQLSTSVDPLTAFRILEMIDCGGQPQFHEILPVFLRHLDFYVFVFRLCDQLDSRPLVEFYVDGKSVGAPVKSSQTVEQLLQHCARSMHTYRSTAGSESGCPKIMVLGTHADLEWKSEESREQKNEKILKLLLPNLEKQIIYHDSNSDQVVFPLNALNPGREEERNIKRIRDILLGSSSVPPVDIPLRWFAFEILLKQMTGALQRGILSREECFTTAMDKLHFEDDAAEFDAAVQYLHNLSVLFYYQDILPEVVFADPQVIYDKVSELVLAHYRLTTNPQSNTSTDDWRKFYKFALVTAEFLSQPEFSKHYVPGLFEREHLIKLFKQLLIFASFSESQLFVPALLRELGKKEVDKFRIPSNIRLTVPSLALEFPDGGPRKGLFCSLLSWLVSPNNDCPTPLCISTNSTRAPICLYRNCIQLDIPKSPATLTLIDAYTHFEVHMQMPEKHAENLCPMLFPSIRKTIFKGLHKAALNLHYSNSTPSAALVCPCGSGDAHIATVNKDIGYWTCSLNKMECDKLSSLQLLWIDSDPISQPSSCDTQQLTEIPHLAMLLSKLNDHAFCWRDIGSSLGFKQGELSNIDASVRQQDNPGPVGCLRAMLSQWLQWAPGDNRGSPLFATLDALKTALRDSGLGAIASSISLH